MSRFKADTHLPRATGTGAWRHLVDLHGTGLDWMMELPFDLKRAEFHPAGINRVTEDELRGWRDELNAWAVDNGFPNKMTEARRSEWDVTLGLRLAEDVADLPEVLHPDTWCWIASYLLPHFVVYRWGWPPAKEGKPPTGWNPWARFGPDLKNALRLALHRVRTYGPEIARRATEQEFQSVQYRPAYGVDQRVARLILQTLVEAADDPESTYGRKGGTRARDANFVCIELRIVNSLQPLCFASDEQIVRTVLDTIEQLPALRDLGQWGELPAPAQLFVAPTREAFGEPGVRPTQHE